MPELDTFLRELDKISSAFIIRDEALKQRELQLIITAWRSDRAIQQLRKLVRPSLLDKLQQIIQWFVNLDALYTSETAEGARHDPYRVDREYSDLLEDLREFCAHLPQRLFATPESQAQMQIALNSFEAKINRKRTALVRTLTGMFLENALQNRNKEDISAINVFAERNEFLDEMEMARKALYELDEQQKREEDADYRVNEEILNLPESNSPRVLSPQPHRFKDQDDEDVPFEPLALVTVTKSKLPESPSKKGAQLFAGEEMDSLVGTLVMEWKKNQNDDNAWVGTNGRDSGWRVHSLPDALPARGIWRPSTSMDCAWNVVRHLNNRQIATIRMDNTKVEFRSMSGKSVGSCECNTKIKMPLAICRAAVECMGHYIQDFTSELIQRFQSGVVAK